MPSILRKYKKKSYKQRSEELEIVCKVFDNMEWPLSQSDGESGPLVSEECQIVTVSLHVAIGPTNECQDHREHQDGHPFLGLHAFPIKKNFEDSPRI